RFNRTTRCPRNESYAFLFAGVLLYLLITAISGIIAYSILLASLADPADPSSYGKREMILPVAMAIPLISLIGFPLAYLLYSVKDRAWVLIASPLFLFMGGCLLFVPLWSQSFDPGNQVDYLELAGI